MATDQARIRVALPAKRPDVLTIVGLFFLAAVGVWLLVNFSKAPADFYNLFLIGLTNGCVYGLVAIGYSLVYGILELINFAHGDVFMLGGMLVATMVTDWSLQNESGIGLWLFIILMLLIAMAFCASINTTIELVAYRRLRNAPRLAPLITAIGMSFILQNIGLVWTGAPPTSVPDIRPPGAVITNGGVAYTWNMVSVVLFTIPVLLALMWLVQRTRHGKAMRATAQDREAAAMMGISVNRTISFTFFIAGSLAGAAALLYALY